MHRRPQPRLLFLLFICWNLLDLALSGLVLNDFIAHYEPVFYDERELQEQHRRHKREVLHDIRLTFHAHNRLFKLRLRRDVSVFTDDVIVETTAGPSKYLPHGIYEGQLEDDEETEVRGILTSEGLFDGNIETRNELYYVEPASRYNLQAPDFHTIMYRASDVTDPSVSAPCPSHHMHLSRLRDKTNSILLDTLENIVEQNKVDDKSRYNVYKTKNDIGFQIAWNATEPKSTISVINASSPQTAQSDTKGSQPNATRDYNAHPGSYIDYELYSGVPRNAFIHKMQKWHKNKWRKSKRDVAPDPTKTTCMLYLQGDHLFYRQMGSEEKCIDTMTRHVQRVNSIYKVADFDGDGKIDNISFMIKRIKVHTNASLDDPNYRFPYNYGVEKFLEIFSEEDYDAFCLAYMFTYRDFEGGTLGLAWTGDLKNAGGVCEKNGHYRGSLKSLNTGIVTLLNYGKRVPPAVSHVTLAHEIGHNFGSPHDPEQNRRCTPGGEAGNYIMFARATSGDKLNNNQFSPCSLKSINNVLSAKARDAKGCFTEPRASICGNEVVEPGEECDCGWEGDCGEDCCWPMTTNPAPHQKPCTMKPHKMCSPSQGPCCTSDCQLTIANKCRDDNGCRDTSYCNGRSPKCPPSINKPNKTICNGEFVCFKGECTGSICVAYGLESCQCTRNPGDSVTKSCELCCKRPGSDQPCVSSFEWNEYPFDIPDLYAKPGTPCDNYNGYCDVFQKCREVDPSGPLATLRQLILSTEGLANLQRWIQDHWYTVVIAVLGLLIAMVFVVRVFGKVPKIKMKKMTIYHSGSDFRVDAISPHHVVHPTTVRQKMPFRRKVREGKHKSGQRKTQRRAVLTVLKPGHVKTKAPSLILGYKGAKTKTKKMETSTKETKSKEKKTKEVVQKSSKEKTERTSVNNTTEPIRPQKSESTNGIVHPPKTKIITVDETKPVDVSLAEETKKSPVLKTSNSAERKGNSETKKPPTRNEAYKKKISRGTEKNKKRPHSRSPEKRLTRSRTPDQLRKKPSSPEKRPKEGRKKSNNHKKLPKLMTTPHVDERTKEWVNQVVAAAASPLDINEYNHESLYAVTPITTPSKETAPEFPTKATDFVGHINAVYEDSPVIGPRKKDSLSQHDSSKQSSLSRTGLVTPPTPPVTQPPRRHSSRLKAQLEKPKLNKAKNLIKTDSVGEESDGSDTLLVAYGHSNG